MLAAVEVVAGVRCAGVAIITIPWLVHAPDGGIACVGGAEACIAAVDGLVRAAAARQAGVVCTGVSIVAIHGCSLTGSRDAAGFSRRASVTVIARSRKALSPTETVAASVTGRARIEIVARSRNVRPLASTAATAVSRRANITIVTRARRRLALAKTVAAGVVRRANIVVVARVGVGLTLAGPVVAGVRTRAGIVVVAQGTRERHSRATGRTRGAGTRHAHAGV